MLAVPITVYYVVLHALPEHLTRIGTDDLGRPVFNDDRFWEARGASFGALVGLILLGWLPLFLWKAHVSSIPSSECGSAG